MLFASVHYCEKQSQRDLYAKVYQVPLIARFFILRSHSFFELSQYSATTAPDDVTKTFALEICWNMTSKKFIPR